MVLDEARVRGAARGGEHGFHPGFGLDRARDQRHERAGRGEEAFARDLGAHREADAGRGADPGRQRLAPGDQAGRAVGVVEADVDRGARLRRDHVVRRVAAVDRRDLQRRGLEMRGAGIERRRGHLAEQVDQRMERVLRPLRIGGVALHARRLDPEGHRAAPADLHHLAHHLGAGRLAHQAHRHRLAGLGHPVEERAGAVAPRAFLVAGDREDHRALGRRLGHQIDRGGDEGRDARFHVGGAAAPEHAVMDLAAEGIMRPGRGIAHRHHVGMAVEAEGLRPFRAPAGEEIGDAVAIDAGAGEASPAQHLFEQHERAPLARRDRGAADQIGGEFHGVERHRGLLLMAHQA
ncbi:hypothetical protein SDC9_34793 [bioreactor metagenome]|uniref:Uncharacterized protein n=1 Tax=bioreactor metagenome TaxID=1076179 RepID=A0A644VBQ1_9ZZZZ